MLTMCSLFEHGSQVSQTLGHSHNFCITIALVYLTGRTDYIGGMFCGWVDAYISLSIAYRVPKRLDHNVEGFMEATACPL